MFLNFIALVLFAFSQDVSHVKYVHVINSCHLDIGFAGSSLGIVNEYFDHHFPYAIEVGTNLTHVIPNWNFMFQSWVVYLYLHCPQNDWGFHCPSDAQKKAFEDAIRSGIISWHAFPYNAELETLDPILIQEGIRLTHMLDEEFGLETKMTLSQRDVPGMSRSVIPILSKMGVAAVAVGVNTASSPPTVPRVFRWVDHSGSDILGMWHPRGYGGNGAKDAVVFDGFEHALVPSWQGDNHGPANVKSYIDTYEKIRKEFPNAIVFSSTYNNFTKRLVDIRDKLPVVTSEIGDTWIYGIQSDPVKVAKMRAMNRVWANFSGDRNDETYLNATFWALKNGEHTWGRDVKSNLKDDFNWTNVAFHAANASHVRGYDTLEQSWVEQREWGINRPLKILQDANHPMAKKLEDEFKFIDAPKSSFFDFLHNENSGYSLQTENSPMKFGPYTIELNPDTGAFASLEYLGIDWISAEDSLFSLVYRTYNLTDYNNFFDNYVSEHPIPGYFPLDFGKPHMPNVSSTLYKTSLKKVWTSKSTLVIQVDFPKEVNSDFGGSSATYLQFEFNEDGTFDIIVKFVDKTSTRLPESMHFMIHAALDSKYRFNIVDELVDPLDVVSRAAKRLHSVNSVSQSYLDGQTMNIDFVDCGLACLGEPQAFPTPVDATPDVKKYGANAILWDNLWGTNYVMWYPFAAESASLQYRFQVSLQQN